MSAIYSINHVYEVALSEEIRTIAVGNVLQGARKSREFRYYASLDKDKIIKMAEKWILEYKNDKHNPITIYDGISRKQRVIIVPTFRELVVQHCIVEALKPLFRRTMYRHSYASIPQISYFNGNYQKNIRPDGEIVLKPKPYYDIRGAHSGKKFIERWLKNEIDTQYVLKMDIRHFFENISHKVLKRKLKQRIHDEKMVNLIFEIISVTDKGLPLGFYTSQWLSNWYLDELDHYIKEELHAKYYIRYMDDLVIFSGNKKELHNFRRLIQKFLKDKLDLTLKNNWQVFRFIYEDENKKEHGRPLDFMGFQFYRNKVIIRKSIFYKCTRKAKRLSKKDKITVYEARQFMAYNGYLSCTDSYNAYLEYIKPYISIRYLKHRISVYDKREAKKEKMKKKRGHYD